MNEYLTVKEISDLTGKSTKTVRNNITSKADYFNKKFGKTTVIKRGRSFLISSAFVEKFYSLPKTPYLFREEKNPFTEIKNPFTEENNPFREETIKKDDFSNKYIAILEEQIKIKDKRISYFEEENKAKTILIGDLQLTNRQLKLGERGTKQTSEITNDKKESVWWVIVSLIILLAVFGGLYYMLYN